MNSTLGTMDAVKDDLLRVAGSLKLGRVTASLFIAKLQSFRRQNVLTRALQEVMYQHQHVPLPFEPLRRCPAAGRRST